ncbi:cytochrome c biogenesis protein ResB [Nocardiopsis alborubida]|uniref:Cytochrome c biogenesis protein ResB n=1 Tax=Nocardiopsis alborubida TaxID=146802 RepID=A0A7X6M8H4_9ACTN|nr:cytochrome c biogenesis protein ResB [Nocardiopsis alborubida]NKY96676.1 cytochrome c biogenesis protein ResB [Nocardiopsis alborubida]
MSTIKTETENAGKADVADGKNDGHQPRGLGPVGWLRWAWRVLTSMRTALILLFLLAVGAIPGSFLPQNVVSVAEVQTYFEENPELAPWLDRFYLFDVFSSPWYAAIYLLLFVSLAGCVFPRAMAHARAVRSRPVRTPRNLGRMPYAARFTTDADPETVLERARGVLGRYRIERYGDSLSTETGYLREAGNVLFHLALLGLLLALAAGSFFGYRGNQLLVEGQGFANTLTSYDAFYPGHWTDTGDLEPFSLHLEDFEAEFIEEGELRGQAESYVADLTYRETPQSEEERHQLEVNHPLSVNGVQVYLLGHGYAPEFEVRNADGEVVFEQAVPFLFRETATYTSDGVVKVPDTGGEQLGFVGVFLPTAAENAEGELVSTFPGVQNPRVTLEGYQGDLGLIDPQSVYQLKTSDMEKLGSSPVMEIGDTWELPDGAGSITFSGYKDYISIQINRDGARLPALAAASLIVVGLIITLFVRPRRVWVRATRGEDGRTRVELAGLGKTEVAGNNVEFHELTTELARRLQSKSDGNPRSSTPSGPPELTAT